MFSLCSNSSQEFNECSLTRVPKVFSTAHMFRFSLKCARFLYGKLGKHWENMIPELLRMFQETLFQVLLTFY